LVLRKYEFSYGLVVSCPGKRTFTSPKKAVDPRFPMRASNVFSQAIPFSPHLFAETKMEELGKSDPDPFRLRRLPFCPGNEKVGLIDQQKWR
jgi:hypothetical protein